MFPNSLGGHGRSINLASARQSMRRVPGVPGAGETDAYFKKILALFPLADRVGYWPMSEATGSVAVDYSGRGHNGAYTAVTLNQPGLGDGRGAPLFDGTTSFNNVYSAGLNTDWNAAEGSVSIWAKVTNVGVWTDGVNRRLFSFQADASNLVQIIKSANAVSFSHTSGGTAKSVSVSQTGIGWLHLVITWSTSADQLKAYMNGAQVGTTQTVLGTWVGALAATTAVVGAASTTPGNPFSGTLAHALLLNRAATPAEVVAMATVG